MSAVMKTRVIKIGNSQGIRLPKLLREQIHLGEMAEIEIEKGQTVIRPAQRPRQGWEEQFRAMAEHGDDRLLDEAGPSLTSWDADGWQW